MTLIIKALNIKSKKRLLESVRGKDHVAYKDRLIRITPDFPKESLKHRRASTVVQTVRDQRCQTRLLYLAKLSITIDGKIRSSMIKSNLSSIHL